MAVAKKIVNTLDEEPGGCSNSIISEEDWRIAEKNSFKNIEDLQQNMFLSSNDISALKPVVKKYHMRITPYYLSLVQNPFNSQDPIRKQCVPSLEELYDTEEDTLDPLGEEKTSPIPCLVHRYPDRVLFVVTGRCFMYCRHCTRKRLWKNKNCEPTLKELELGFQYIKDNPQIREVVVSGGDPLTLPTKKLDYILSNLARLGNIQAIRIGTRTPVVFPQRIDEPLCAMLEKYSSLWINVQFNHPREITPESTEACRKLQRCGIPLNNQSVLLKGVNDDPQVMIELCHKLQSIRVRPYYLFECDPVVGASHFRTPVGKGIEIIKKMRGYTGGMCVPTFVVDGIDGRGKVPLNPDYLVSINDDEVVLKSYNGEVFRYRNPREASELTSP